MLFVFAGDLSEVDQPCLGVKVKRRMRAVDIPRAAASCGATYLTARTMGGVPQPQRGRSGGKYVTVVQREAESGEEECRGAVTA